MNSSSLFDATEQSALTQAANWIATLLSGTLTTTIAVVIVGCLGMMLLSGRFQIRRTAQTIVGLFLLFGAADTAASILGFVSNAPSEEASSISLSQYTTSPESPRPPVLDPYAGASLPMPQ